jgi:hypothetical protein
MESHNTFLNWLGNIASVGAVLTSMFGYIPAIGALVAIVWYSIQIYESDTVKRWQWDRLRRKLMRLQQEAAEIERKIAAAGKSEQAPHDTKTPAVTGASERH